jgi:hypothetical protein
MAFWEKRIGNMLFLVTSHKTVKQFSFLTRMAGIPRIEHFLVLPYIGRDSLQAKKTGGHYR